MNKVKQFRHENLIYLIRSQCDGSQSLFAQKVNLHKTYISNLYRQVRDMGEQTATKIENAFNLPQGWMSERQPWSLDHEVVEYPNTVPAENNNLSNKDSSCTWIPIVDWYQIPQLLNDSKEAISTESVAVSAPVSKDSFACYLPETRSIIEVARSGDLLIVDPSVSIQNAVDSSYAIACTSNGVIQALQVLRSGDDVYYLNQDPKFSQKPFPATNMQFVGSIVLSIKHMPHAKKYA